MRSNVLRPAILAVVAAALLAGCSSSGSTQSPAASAAAMTAGPGGTISATDAWARAMPPGSTTSAVYVKLTNLTGTDDALVSASTPAAPTAEIHEVSAVSAAPEESAGMGAEGSAKPEESAGMGGAMMGMHPIEKLPLPAGATVELKPGSFHIMLIDVPQPLKDGSTIEVTLTFEKAPPITITVPVKMS